MPIYEYRCTSCGHELEALQKLSDAPLTVCPACQKSDLRKRVSAAGFQLKGSGWYVTDFRNSGAKPSTKDAAAKANGGNGEAKAETKPADSAPGEKTAGTSQPTGSSGEAKAPATASGPKPDN